MLPFTVLPHMSTAEDENELPDSLATFTTFGFKKEMTEEAHRAHNLERRVRLHAGYVYRQGVDDDRSIYFVRDGVIELCQENNQGGSVRLGKGDCFGQMCLAWLKEPSECLRMHSARAITECSLYLLNRSALLELEVIARVLLLARLLICDASSFAFVTVASAHAAFRRIVLWLWND